MNALVKLMLAVRASRITEYMSVTFGLGAFGRQGKENFLKDFILCVSVSFCMYVYMPAGANGGCQISWN